MPSRCRDRGGTQNWATFAVVLFRLVRFDSLAAMGWQWGKRRRPGGAPRFALSWIVIFVLALGIVMTGYDPVKITEYSVIFSVVALPLTFLPILLVLPLGVFFGSHRRRRRS